MNWRLVQLSFNTIRFHLAILLAIRPASTSIRCLQSPKHRSIPLAALLASLKCHYSGGVMQFGDRDIKCSTCGLEFVFSAGEQQFFEERGFTNDPKRCKQCKAKRAGGTRVRPETHVQCSLCGIAT